MNKNIKDSKGRRPLARVQRAAPSGGVSQSFTSNQFISCDKEFGVSSLVLFGAGYDGTTSNRPGARFAGKAVRGESFGMETYSPYQDRDLEDLSVCDLGELDLPFGAPEKPLAIIRRTCDDILAAGKTPVMIGGEHLVSLPAIEACHAKFPDLRVIHFDAHADLREDYLGERLSHACVMRRVFDLLGKGRIFQHGIRSGTREEFLFARENCVIERFTVANVPATAAAIGNFPVYLTIDADVLDTSVFPATGTPEAGGVSFTELLNALLSLRGVNIVGADIVELSPPYDTSGASTALVCKLIREVMMVMH